MWRSSIVFIMCWGGSICGNQPMDEQLLKDYIDQNDSKEIGPISEFWIFNDQIYAQNAYGQWVPFSPGLDAYVEDLARRGLCPKWHRGVHLDKSFYKPGIWYCDTIVDGEKCFFHIDRQFPNGIPKGR